MNDGLEGVSGSEDRAQHLDEFFGKISQRLTNLSDSFFSDSPNVSYKALVRNRVRFRSTLCEIKKLEEEFLNLEGYIHCSYSVIKEKLTGLIKRATSEINYRDAQRINLN